jgi:hypothetical protein
MQRGRIGAVARSVIKAADELSSDLGYLRPPRRRLAVS